MKLWIRADGSATTGLGHIMRAMAVAEASIARGAQVRYVTTRDDGIATSLLRERGYELDLVEDRHDPTWTSSITSGDAVLFDGYEFNEADRSSARSRGAWIAVVDDFGRGEFDVDILINPAGLDHGYETPSGTKRLFGPRYALVREEFRAHRSSRNSGRGRLLITFGATDASSIGTPVARAARAAGAFDETVLLVGPGTDMPPEADLEVVRADQHVAATFASSSAAIAAAGSTTWELLTLGIPSALVEVADNQTDTSRVASEAGAALFAGSKEEALDRMDETVAELADPERQEQLAAAAMELVDGRGAERVVDAINRLAIGP